MPFDPKIHEVKQILIKCGRALREAKGLPEENNITILYEEASLALGIPTIQTTTQDANHLSAPHEMMMPNGKFLVPRKDCSHCGKKESMMLMALCQSCEDAEHGKYRTMWYCGKDDLNRTFIPESGCGTKEKSDKFYTQWLTELGVEIPTGTKEQLGIKTFTDTEPK